MENVRGLNMLTIGESAVVKQLCMEGPMRRRLQDIGLVQGTRVRCVLKSAGGDPAAYLIRGALIAIRKEDSAKVLVC